MAENNGRGVTGMEKNLKEKMYENKIFEITTI